LESEVSRLATIFGSPPTPPRAPDQRFSSEFLLFTELSLSW